MSSLGTETALESKEPRLYYKYAVLKEKLLTEVYTRWAQGFPEGNDHGPEHIQRVLEKLDQLVGPNPIGTSIRPYELYLAMMSILYHDIGILRSRKNHADEASNELGKKISGTPYFEHDNDNNLFDPFDRDVIRAAVVSHSSSKDIERECQAFPHEFAIGVHVVRPRFIAALVRLADELDEDYRRAPQFAQQLTQLPKGSLFYWRFCQRISGIRAERDQHMIVIDAKLEMDDVDYMVEVNKNEQPFTSAFADKLAKINGERRSTNRFLIPALNYSRILVSLRPPDNHPTWVSPKEFFFADGTSSTDFLNILSELLPLNLLDPIIESHPVSPVMPQAIKFQELTKTIFDKSTNDEDKNEHSQEQKRIIGLIRDSIEDKELKLSEGEIKKCRQSPFYLDRITLYLFEEHISQPNFDILVNHVEDEWEQIKASNYSGTLRPLHYSIRSVHRLLENQPEQAKVGKSKIHLFKRILDLLKEKQRLPMDNDDIKPNLERIIARLEGT